MQQQQPDGWPHPLDITAPRNPPTTHRPHRRGAFCNSCSSLVALTHFQKSRVIIGLADICLKLALFKSQKCWEGLGIRDPRKVCCFFTPTRVSALIFFCGWQCVLFCSCPPLACGLLSATLCQF